MFIIFEEGIYDRIKRDIITPKSICPSNDFTYVDFELVITFFALLLIGIMFSLIVFAIEVRGLGSLLQSIVWP